MITDENKKLVFEDGTAFYGRSFGSGSEKVLELVFNTSPVGYQEILSDKNRMNRAIRVAEKQAKDLTKRANAMQSVARTKAAGGRIGRRKG